MHGSLSWIEWLERVERSLAGARADIVALGHSRSPRRVAPIGGSSRRLSALIEELRCLDRAVLVDDHDPQDGDAVGDLLAALETARFRLDALTRIAEAERAPSASDPHRGLAAVDTALREARRAAANLFAPRRLRA